MSIRVVCPNGHALHVKNALAGKIGLCPTCKAQIQIPKLRPDKLSEDAILDILGPPDKETADLESAEEQAPSPGIPNKSLQKKTCSMCHQEIAATIHICPHCKTYIA